MTRAEVLAALDEVRQAMHDQFPDNAARLGQLDSHIATVAMVVDHLHDEDAREASQTGAQA